MNKYQEAYSYIKHYCELDDDCVKWPLYQRSIRSLQELVDKETPKKPVIRGLSVAIHTCPVCDKELIVTNDEIVIYKTKTNYCDNCGQRLDWSDE